MTERRHPSAELDPAVTLERLGLASRSHYPPGFYGTLRHRLPFFALVGALSILFSLIPFPHQHTGEVLVAGGIFFALTAAAIVLPWSRLPQWFWSVIPIGYVSVIALIRDAQGAASEGISIIYLLPIAWLAFYGRRAPVIVGLSAVTVALALPIVVVGGTQYPVTQWRLALVMVAMSSLLAFSFLTMVGRDRKYVADLADQSMLAHDNAAKAVDAKNQVESILRAATETAIIGIDVGGTVTFFSAGAERMLGYTAAEVVGRLPISRFLDPAEVAERRGEIQAMVQAARTGRAMPVAVEDAVWTYVRKDGLSRRGAVTLNARPGSERLLGYVVVAIDVTEREQLGAERERLLAAQREVTEVLAEQNHRLLELTQMKDDVVATVSHELRTPLTSIRGYVELLLEAGSNNLDTEQEKMLRTIDRNSLQLLRVAEDLLADPGGGHGLRVHFFDTDISKIASWAMETMAAQAAHRHVKLSMECEPGVVVHGDPDRIHQLFSNLLSNAVKFTRVAGRVLLRVESIGQFARIEVLDDGPGIPKDERSQLFERFYRLASTHRQGIPGSGLGLAIAKSVVEAHEGTIDIAETPGWSTTFRVLLPLAASRAFSVTYAPESPVAQSAAAESPVAQSAEAQSAEAQSAAAESAPNPDSPPPPAAPGATVAPPPPPPPPPPPRSATVPASHSVGRQPAG